MTHYCSMQLNIINTMYPMLTNHTQKTKIRAFAEEPEELVTSHIITLLTLQTKLEWDEFVIY